MNNKKRREKNYPECEGCSSPGLVNGFFLLVAGPAHLIAPQMPRPAPRAITRVCSTPIAELKNAIDSPPCECRGTSPDDRVKNKKALRLHVHLQEKGSKIARTLMSAWLCKRHI